MITYNVHHQGLRENQYEIIFDLIEDGRVILGNSIYAVGSEKLDEEDINNLMVNDIIPRVENIRSLEEHPEQQNIFTRGEIELFLRESGRITEEETMEDFMEREVV